MIPKIIHYCWFGGSPIPEEAMKCIESWKKYCPGYEIKEWNESNFNVNSCKYSKEAYREGKWAFVSDYARFKILYDEGGLYFDTDVELIKSIDDIVSKGPFMGCEKGDNLLVNSGLGLGAQSGLQIYKEVLDYYETQHFLNEDGSINTMTVVKRVTDILIDHGFKGNGEIETIECINVYPPDFFCPMDYWTGHLNITSNTRSIHHYSMTWKSEYEKKLKLFERKCLTVFGKRIGKLIYKIVTKPYRKIYNRSKGKE